MATKRRGIQSVEIGVGVLGALAGLGRPGSLSEIAKASGLAPSAAHRYLASLVNTGLVRQDAATSLYDLDSGALRLGLAALSRMDVLEEAGRVARDLVAATGRTALLALWADLGPTIIRWYPGDPPVYTTLAIGSRLSLTQSATGRVFLTFLGEGYVSPVLEAERDRARTTGLPDVEDIRRQVRRDLAGHVDGLQIPGLRASAAPIFDAQGRLAMVATVIASHGFAPEEDGAVRARLVEACRDLTRRLGGPWPGTG